jgi:myo-inositol 2-dehydrogenase/D-chiro-inositol 1-dehydrogenase
VFCEKPLALNVEDCQKVEAVAADYPQLKAMVGFVRRFDASYQDAAKKLRRCGGPAYLLRSQTCDLNDENGFFKFAPSSGGIFMDCSIHDIDLARWLLGSPKPVRVWATGTNACIRHWPIAVTWTMAWPCWNLPMASWPASMPRAPRHMAMKP